MPKSYYRRCKNSSFVNGYNEMRIRKRQVHCWPFLTGILIYDESTYMYGTQRKLTIQERLRQKLQDRHRQARQIFQSMPPI